MGWIQKLHETYERCSRTIAPERNKLWPVSHFVKKAHVEIEIDDAGCFRNARTLSWSEASTLIPATESSAGRTSGVSPHPLSEEIGYCASDFPNLNIEKYSEYVSLLEEWCNSEFSHPKLFPLLTYIRKGKLWSDLKHLEIFPVVIEGVRKNKTKVADEKVFVRWRIDSPGDPCTGTWEDIELINAWIAFDRVKNNCLGFCMVTGLSERICQNHPRFIRGTDDGAKLISANDFSGFTFRGRFTDRKEDYQKQPCSVGFEVSQKAHSALRWLIGRQSYRNGDQVFVAWAVGGKPTPDPWSNSMDLFSDGEASIPSDSTQSPTATDAGQVFATRLNRAIAGYRADLSDVEDIVVMGLDSATPGRMAMTFYRELKGSDFLEHIETWHRDHAWAQNFGKDSKFLGAPSPRDIAEAAFGRRIDDKLRKNVVERLTPCIIDGMHLPRDLVDACVHRVFNRAGMERWEWEKCLGIACAVYRGFHSQRRYQMTLEEGRRSRDYLYGRLLAVAEHIEGRALYVAGENRDTTAARLMQRFADRPFSTWRTIELALTPYKSRLRASRGGFLWEMEQLLDRLIHSFPEDESESFANDRPLSGEFLLGYHCQRQNLRPMAETHEADSTNHD